VIQRLLFDRVDAKTAGTPITDQFDFIIEALTHVTKAALAFFHVAVAGTEIALQATVFHLVPVLCRNNGIVHGL
jgi:hypothetical protein